MLYLGVFYNLELAEDGMVQIAASEVSREGLLCFLLFFGVDDLFGGCCWLLELWWGGGSGVVRGGVEGLAHSKHTAPRNYKP